MTDAAQDANDSSTAGKPKRNPIERILVWGLILVGVVIASTEGIARFSYSMSLSALQERVHDDEEGDGAGALTISSAEELMVGFPKKEVGNNRVTYRFKGLVKEFGAIHLQFDDEDLVLGLETDAPPEVEENAVQEEIEEEVQLNEDGEIDES